MELWVRSQDKRHLIKADYISIMENNIINVASSGWDYDVAKYSTKERALEVLDEIQNRIFRTQKDESDYTYSQYNHLIRSRTFKETNYVYEMPEE